MSRHAPLPVATLGWFWLVTGLALVIAPHLLRFPGWLSLVCVVAIGWRVARDLRGWPLPSTAVRLALTLLGIGAVIAAYGTVLGQDAGVALLAVMLSLKLMEMVTLRDAMVVVLLAYFLVAAGFLFDQSLFAGLYLFGTVVVLTAALVVLNHPSARRGLNGDYLRISVALLFQALPLMAVLFVLFPRAPSLGFGLTTTARHHTGLSDSMSVGDVSDLANSREVAFRVEFGSRPPSEKEWYWRGPVLWHTDGRHWRGLTPSEMRAAGPPPPFRALSAPLDYTVTLEPEAVGRWLPALDVPALVPDSSAVSTDLQLIATDRSERARRYVMRSFLRYQLTGLAPAQRRLALALPPEENPRTRELGERWAREFGPPEERVAEALRHFREKPFYYTRRPPLLGPDPVDQFLFETRRGFCEHYAAAFVVLMRAAGVPARVVTGYQGGEFNPMGNYWLVRQSDAHAWAEVYLEAQGWVRVDPTFLLPTERIDAELLTEDGADRSHGTAGEAPAWAQRSLRWVAHGWDTVNFQWNRWVAGYSGERQQELLQRLGLREWGRRGLIVLLVVAAIAAVVGVTLLGRWGRERDPVVRLYGRFCAKLARRGIIRRREEGEQAFAARVTALRPELAAQVESITATYQQLRYGRPPAGHLRRLREAVSAFKP